MNGVLAYMWLKFVVNVGKKYSSSMGHLGVTHGVVTNSYRSRVVTTSIYPFVFGLKVTQVKFVGKFCSAIIDP